MQGVDAPKSLPDIIFVSLENWDDIWRRNQFLCTGLAKRFPNTKILFVGLARDVSNDIRHGRMPKFSEDITSVPGYPNISVTRPIKLLPNTVPIFRKFNEFLYRAHVRSAATSAGLNNALLWLNPHSAVHMVGRLNEMSVIYDITDDWTTLTQSDVLTRLTIAQDAELCARASAVIVCSERLFEMKRKMSKNLHLIPNGVDSKHYSCVLDGDGVLPEIAQSWKNPVLGYVGTIHPDRVDLDLIERVAKKLPDATIALVGPNFLTTDEQQKMTNLGNVVLTGPMPYANIPQIMRAFDICITPHLVTPFTESLNPIKLWEYLAAGKPIVSTNVAGFREYPQYVRIANTAQEFADAAMESLSEDVKLKEQRRAEALLNSWDARLDQVFDVVKSCGAAQRSAETREAVHAY